MLATSGALAARASVHGRKTDRAANGRIFPGERATASCRGHAGKLPVRGNADARIRVAPPVAGSFSRRRPSDGDAYCASDCGTRFDRSDAAPAPTAQPAAPETKCYVQRSRAREREPSLSPRHRKIRCPRLRRYPAITVPVTRRFRRSRIRRPIRRPPDPSPDLVLLIRTARVDPDWEFNGRVEAPAFAKSMEKALGVTPAAQPSQTPRQPGTSQAEKTRRLLAGSERTFRRERQAKSSRANEECRLDRGRMRTACFVVCVAMTREDPSVGLRANAPPSG